MHYQKSILHDNLELASTVIQEMTNIDERDKNGCTALHTAAGYCGADAVTLLLRRGANSKVFDKVSCLSVQLTIR